MLESLQTVPNPANNVVIIGGGFAGAVLAKSLERRLPEAWSIYLLSQDNFITYNPLLAEVVGASVLPGHVVAPLRQMLKRTRIRMVNVTGIDVEDKRVNYLGEGSGTLDYGQLVLAYGVDANLDIVKGMAEHGLPLKTVGDALFLRNRIIERLEQATIQPDRERRRWLTTFIVVGGGFSGVEVA
ncbi:MAG: NAD(P)/FAD-dependent oxidoreductase, partial [Pseudomonadales bacterium]